MRTSPPGDSTTPAQSNPAKPAGTTQEKDSAAAEEEVEELAKKAQNPIANLISVPFQNDTNFGVGPLDRTQNVLNIQPVIPVSIRKDWLVVTRTIVPVILQPVPPQGGGSTFGLGDINPQFYFVPKTDSPTYHLGGRADLCLPDGNESGSFGFCGKTRKSRSVIVRRSSNE